MGCEQCLRGAKLVIFVTGRCENPVCQSYCPISLEKRGKDIVYANERRLGNWDSKRMTDCIIAEVERGQSEGASFTGGNPLLVVDRVVRLSECLKGHFGTDFHLHLYAPVHGLKKKQLDELANAIDEIRFHPTSLNELNAVEPAFQKKWDIGIEVPAFPGQIEFLRNIVEWLEDKAFQYDKTPFLNINQLECSESNYQYLLEMGFIQETGSLAAIAGSDKTAIAIVKWSAESIERTNVHYCPSSAKDSIQLPNRLLRYAHMMAEPFDIIREEGPHRGLLIRGVIRGTNPLTEGQQKAVRSILHFRLGIPQDQVAWDPIKGRFLVNPLILEDLAAEVRHLETTENLSLEIGIVEEYPTADGLETGFEPL